MTKTQRSRYEMFVRVRDFGAAYGDLFSATPMAAEWFKHIATAVAAVDEHLKRRVVARAEARGVKATTRAAVSSHLKIVAHAARRIARTDPAASLFQIPRRRSLKLDVVTARAVIDDVIARREAFARFGLTSAFIAELRGLVDNLQHAVNVRLHSRTTRREAQAGIETVLREGLEVVHDLDVVVAVETREDPIRLAAWRAARRIDAQSRLRQGTPTSGKPAPPSATRTTKSPTGPAGLAPAAITVNAP